jgi:hypothetical protein
MVSQADADNLAATDPNYDTNGQAFANDPANGATCTLTSNNLRVFGNSDDTNINLTFAIDTPMGVGCDINYTTSFVQDGVRIVAQGGLATIAAGDTTVNLSFPFATNGDPVTQITVTFNPVTNPIGGVTLTYTSPTNF